MNLDSFTWSQQYHAKGMNLEIEPFLKDYHKELLQSKKNQIIPIKTRQKIMDKIKMRYGLI
jgi:hypothetical protein